MEELRECPLRLKQIELLRIITTRVYNAAVRYGVCDEFFNKTEYLDKIAKLISDATTLEELSVCERMLSSS